MTKLSYIALTSTALLTGQCLANTDLFVADINHEAGNAKLVGVKNITQRSGYDNQPKFAPDNRGLYYTAMFQVTAEQFQTDAMLYDLELGTTTNISQTWETSEYSPTPINNGEGLSFIKVEPDGTQRLWSLDIATRQQTIINSKIKPVGYHAWGKQEALALFVLGEPMTLQYIQTPTQAKGQVVADNIGRSIRYNERHDLFSYSFGDKQQTLAVYFPGTGKTQALLPLPNNAEYYTWLNDDTVLSADGSKIMRWDYKGGSSGWQLFADASQHCQTKISRLAVSQDQKKLAFVCDETGK